MVIPVSFNGYVIIPLDGFSLLGDVKDDGILNLDNIYAMFFGVSLKYDAFANYKLGDISLVKETETVLITDLETLDELAFNEVFVKDYNGDKITLERLGKEVKPAPAKRIGDVKILEDFDYQTSEEIKKEYPVWVGGSEVVNSLENGGMKVEIGGVIPGNNIYASIDIFPKAKVSDWTDWKDAKGVTFYVKNLSPREITINLEFEEMTTTESGEVFERWNIKYGAMIMLQDVSGAEFIVHAKPVFAIPIGFEGWVRIDFSQYWVPEWCTTGDLVLDLNSPITGFF